MFTGGIQVMPSRYRIQRFILDDQCFDVPLHRSQRRTQVVRDIREKFTPQPIAFLQAAHLLLDRIRHVMAGVAQLVDFISWSRDTTDRIVHPEMRFGELRHIGSQPAEPAGQERKQQRSGDECGQHQQDDPRGHHALLVAAGDLRRDSLVLGAAEDHIQVTSVAARIVGSTTGNAENTLRVPGLRGSTPLIGNGRDSESKSRIGPNVDALHRNFVGR